MSTHLSMDEQFIQRISEVIEINLHDEKFGVAELANELGMSRATLHRKVKNIIKKSISEFIRETRLKRAYELLKSKSGTASEIAYMVGFNSATYFNKCFKDFYGCTPGEVLDGHEQSGIEKSKEKDIKRGNYKLAIKAIVVLTIFASFYFSYAHFLGNRNPEKSIAVLPFVDQHPEEGHSYIINGIREDILINMNNLGELRVIPGTSAEKYKDSKLSLQNIAKELNANYILGGKGQKVGNKFRIFLQLFEADTDNLIWTKSFTRQTNDSNLFELQTEIALNVAKELKVYVSSEERERIEKVPTRSQTALDYYYKGLEVSKDNLEEAIKYFEKAILYDSEFAYAYAQLALSYYLMDADWRDRFTKEHEILYRKEISRNADMALLYDSLSDFSLYVKALHFKNEKDYEIAIDYFEKVLEYNSFHFGAMYNLLELYGITGNNEDYIKYALKIINTGFPEESTDKEFAISATCTRLSNKYRGMGFFNKALFYIDEALMQNPKNTFASNVKCQIIQAKEGKEGYRKSIDILRNAIKKDSVSQGLHSRLGQAYYALGDYSSAYHEYNKMFELSGNNASDYKGLHTGRIAYVFREMGRQEIAEDLINNYRDIGESKKTGFKHFILTGYNSFIGDTARAMEHLKLASQYDQRYFCVINLKFEPLYDNIRSHPDFQQSLSEMETKFWTRHEIIKANLKEKGLL